MSNFAGFYKFRTYNQNEIQKIKKIFKYLKFYQHQSDLDKTIYMRRRVEKSPIPNAIKNVASKYINISKTNHNGLFYIYYKDQTNNYNYKEV